MTQENFILFCQIWIFVAIATFFLLMFVTAPYGRHNRKGWGFSIKNKTGWVLMELPSFGIMLYFMVAFGHSLYVYFLFVLWIVHYFNRTFIFPFRIRTKGKSMPVVIVGSAIFFNLINATTNGYFLSYFQSNDMSYESWQFILGITFWLTGFYINIKSDNILINLRTKEDGRYKIPKGFLFNYVSCPNHFGEIVEWLGFAIMAWNLPAWAFFIWTAANLIPRAIKHHQWYQQKFEHYPKKRKALIPYMV